MKRKKRECGKVRFSIYKKEIPEFKCERPVERDKIQAGDIWLHASKSFLGMGIRTATLSDINHAGQVVYNNFLIHALGNGLVKERFDNYLDNKKFRVTIVRIKEDLFADEIEKNRFINLAIEKAEKLYSENKKYDWGIIAKLAINCFYRFLPFTKNKRYVNLVDQKRDKYICSQFVDGVWDELEKQKTLDLFITRFHKYIATPADIWLSKHVRYITGWDYREARL